MNKRKLPNHILSVLPMKYKMKKSKIEEVYNIIAKLENRHGYCMTSQLINKLNLASSTISEHVNKLQSQGRIRIRYAKVRSKNPPYVIICAMYNTVKKQRRGKKQ